MDSFIYGIILAVIAVVLTYFITKSKGDNPNLTLKEKLKNYSTLFAIIGSVIKSVDEELYDEMDDVLKALNDLYDRGVVKSSDVQMLLDEAEDVFNRALELYNSRDAQ